MIIVTCTAIPFVIAWLIGVPWFERWLNTPLHVEYIENVVTERNKVEHGN